MYEGFVFGGKLNFWMRESFTYMIQIFQEYTKNEKRICDQHHPRTGVRLTHKSCLKGGGGWTTNITEWGDDYVTVCVATFFPKKNGAQDQGSF
jgi:hypothetical protein